MTRTRFSAWVLIGFWILLQLVNGLASIAMTEQTGGVAYLAHVGGPVAGVLIALVLRGSTRLWAPARARQPSRCGGIPNAVVARSTVTRSAG